MLRRSGHDRVLLSVTVAMTCLGLCAALGPGGSASRLVKGVASSSTGGGQCGAQGKLSFAGQRLGMGACFVQSGLALAQPEGKGAALCSIRPVGRLLAGKGMRHGGVSRSMVFLPKNDWPEDDQPQRAGDNDFFEEFGDDVGGARLKPRKPAKKKPQTALDLDELEDTPGQRYDYYDPLFGNMQRPAEVNEMLRPMGLEKHRLMIHPDEAFGSIFRYEGSLVDTMVIHKEAWTKVANEMNFTVPDDESVLRAMKMPAERAIQRVMGWTTDWGDTKRIAFRKAEVFFDCWKTHNHTLRQGTVEWLEKLYKAKIPMCVVSEMDAKSINHSMSHMGIEHYFRAYVTAEDDVETREQMYLTACLKLQRPPNHCCVFDNDPDGISAAHDVSSLIVTVLGEHKAWELASSDLMVASLDQLTTYNVRKLFSQVGEGSIESQLELEKEPAKPSRWGGGGGPWASGSEDPDDGYVYSKSLRR